MPTPRLLVLALLALAPAAMGQERSNYFDDPFVAVTSAVPALSLIHI